MLHPVVMCVTFRFIVAVANEELRFVLRDRGQIAAAPLIQAGGNNEARGKHTMSQRFSTDLLPALDRFDAWQWNAQQICGDCRVQHPKSSFHGSIEIRSVGGLRLTHFSSSPLSFWKWPADTVNSDNRSCFVITQIAGIRQYEQNGTSVVLSPGDTTLIDSGRPWSSSCGTNCARLYLRVPLWMMESKLQLQEIPFVQRISSNLGLGATLSQLAQSLYDEGEWLQGGGAAGLDAYFRILSACVGSPRHSEKHFQDPRSRIQRFIDEHLSDPALDPAKVAAAVNISVRHLHRLFLDTGGTLGDCIRILRLEQCRNDLAQPHLRSRTITEIAYFWGFSDSAHFSRSFRKQFGVCPRVFRAQTGLKTGSDDTTPRERNLALAETAELRYSRPN
jgi:AraC family transcriptional activator of tynA and feaB